MQGNALAVLGCQLRHSILFVSMFPVDSSTLGVADHYQSRTTACNMHKHIYAKNKMHINIQVKAENIYIAPIYMYARLELGVYGPYTYI